MSETADYAQTQVLVTGAFLLLGLVPQIAFLVVALTTVRKASPEASTLMITASLLGLFATIAHPIANVVAPMLMPGIEGTLRAFTVTTVIFGLISLVTSSIQLIAIVRLAENRRRE